MPGSILELEALPDAGVLPADDPLLGKKGSEGPQNLAAAAGSPDPTGTGLRRVRPPVAQEPPGTATPSNQNPQKSCPTCARSGTGCLGWGGTQPSQEVAQRTPPPPPPHPAAQHPPASPRSTKRGGMLCVRQPVPRHHGAPRGLVPPHGLVMGRRGGGRGNAGGGLIHVSPKHRGEGRRWTLAVKQRELEASGMRSLLRLVPASPGLGQGSRRAEAFPRVTGKFPEGNSSGHPCFQTAPAAATGKAVTKSAVLPRAKLGAPAGTGSWSQRSTGTEGFPGEGKEGALRFARQVEDLRIFPFGGL